jgi:PAS domain S-box-containing protein
LFHARRRVAGLEQAGTEMRRLQAEVENLALEKTLALLASEKRASRILQAANDGFWDWNVETGEVWFSAQWGRLLGYGQGEIPPRVEFFFSILHADDVERAREEVGKLVEGESNVRTFDVRVRRRAGEYLWVQWRGNAAERDPAGTVVRVVGTLTDLTETRRLEGDFRQAQKMETIGQMAGGIAHDFNNLLTVINGYSQRMLGRMGPADPLRESAAGILQAGRRAADLTKQLLAFSRNSTYAPAVLDVNEMVDGSESILRRIAGDAVRLEVVRNRDAGRVKIDPTQFRQVLLNLTANAKDAMPNGGRLRIEVSSVELDEDFAARNMGTSPGRYVRVDVSDTGTGMGEASRPRVFEPFFTTKEHGTGLGLATVHGIVRQHGGWISVHSDPSSGTTFRTYWPRTEEVAEAVPAGFGAASVEGGSETVLVVEDQADVRAMVAEMLASLGYRTLQTAGGETALAVAAGERGRIDLLLTDVAMYGMDGVRLAARMVGQRPDLKVLFMSGLGEQAVPEGAEFLAKPFTREGLAAKLRTVLDGVVNVG